MAVQPRKQYGAPPRTRVRVQVQLVEGTKVTSTQSFTLYEHDYKDVLDTIEAALDKAYLEEEEIEIPKKLKRIRRA